MRNARYILAAIVTATVVATTVVGLTFGVIWAIVASVAGMLGSLVAATYLVVRSLQSVLQRLSGVIKQQERIVLRQERLEELHGDLREHVKSGGLAVVPPEVRRACEDLTLASRSLTVPQAHFDQLLRTIAANTVRTEAAVDDAVAALKHRM